MISFFESCRHRKCISIIAMILLKSFVTNVELPRNNVEKMCIIYSMAKCVYTTLENMHVTKWVNTYFKVHPVYVVSAECSPNVCCTSFAMFSSLFEAIRRWCVWNLHCCYLYISNVSSNSKAQLWHLLTWTHVSWMHF